MATKKKTEIDPKDMSVADKLKTLYELQTTLSKIDEIKTVRGELPLEVQDLEDEIEGKNTRLGRIQEDIANTKKEVATRKVNLDTAKDAINKYTDQQNNVSNNRQYDLLSKEIEFQKLEVELSEKKIREGGEQLATLEVTLDETRNELDELQKNLEEKKGELDDIISETKAEEEKLRGEANSLEDRIEPRLLQSFKRIRRNARNGLGIVCVQRDACGGCFNKIPPQRQLDVRNRKKIIVCEYCGRILIDPELAGIEVEAPAQEAAPKRTRRRTAKEE